MDVEFFPVPRCAEGGGDASGGVTEPWHDGHAGQEAAFPEDERGMEMTDDGHFDLVEFGLHDRVVGQERESGGVVRKENDFFITGKFRKGGADPVEMLAADF